MHIIFALTEKGIMWYAITEDTIRADINDENVRHDENQPAIECSDVSGINTPDDHLACSRCGTTQMVGCQVVRSNETLEICAGDGSRFNMNSYKFTTGGPEWPASLICDDCMIHLLKERIIMCCKSRDHTTRYPVYCCHCFMWDDPLTDKTAGRCDAFIYRDTIHGNRPSSLVVKKNRIVIAPLVGPYFEGGSLCDDCFARIKGTTPDANIYIRDVSPWDGMSVYYNAEMMLDELAGKWSLCDFCLSSS